ncbi:MAG: glutamate-1-semialdehyde 2,1-aminomutase [Candidatus Rhabdochlamydia sp.]
MKRVKSLSIFQEACQRMPGGVSSPVRACKGLDMTPLIIERAKGSTLFDVDGNRYTDYCTSFGALIVGHAHPEVVKSTISQIHKGSSFGATAEEEVLLAKKILQHLPSMDKLRFVSSGTESTMTALRLARAYTGKDVIIKFTGHYHGHSDALLVKAGSGVLGINPTSSSKGVPSSWIHSTLSLPFNDLVTCQSILRARDDIAAVILEPIAANQGLIPANVDFIQMLREETDKKGIILIFDEVITGFRLGLGGAQELYHIKPDLTCLGKIIGGGFPAAAFGGKKALMDQLAPLGEVYQAGTLSGNPVAMSAGLKTLELLETPDCYETLAYQTTLITEALREKINQEKVNIEVIQAGSMFALSLKTEGSSSFEPLSLKQYHYLFHQFFNHSIYLSPSPYEVNFVSLAHTEPDIHQMLEVIQRLEFKLF